MDRKRNQPNRTHNSLGHNIPKCHAYNIHFPFILKMFITKTEFIKCIAYDCVLAAFPLKNSGEQHGKLSLLNLVYAYLSEIYLHFEMYFCHIYIFSPKHYI